MKMEATKKKSSKEIKENNSSSFLLFYSALNRFFFFRSTSLAEQTCISLGHKNNGNKREKKKINLKVLPYSTGLMCICFK